MLRPFGLDHVERGDVHGKDGPIARHTHQTDGRRLQHRAQSRLERAALHGARQDRWQARQEFLALDDNVIGPAVEDLLRRGIVEHGGDGDDPHGKIVLADVADQRVALAVHLAQIDQDGVVMTRARFETLDGLAGRRGRVQAQIGVEGAEFAPKSVGLAKVRRDVQDVHVS